MRGPVSHSRPPGPHLRLGRGRLLIGCSACRARSHDAADSGACPCSVGPLSFALRALRDGETSEQPADEPAAEITAELLDIAAGTAERPVRGSGVVVAWHGVLGVEGGRLSVFMLRKAEIHADGGSLRSPRT
jgi:hypothetical protein